MGVEPTIRAAKDRIAGFEGREGHRTPFASVMILLDLLSIRKLRHDRNECRCYCGAARELPAEDLPSFIGET